MCFDDGAPEGLRVVVPRGVKIRKVFERLMPKEELRDIGTSRERDADAGPGALFRIVEQEPLAHFAGGVAHHRIAVGVPGWRPVEDFHAQRSLLEQIRLTFQGALDYELEERRVALAVAKVRAGQDLL
jgi:hypothetical protein